MFYEFDNIMKLLDSLLSMGGLKCYQDKSSTVIFLLHVYCISSKDNGSLPLADQDRIQEGYPFP